MTLMSKQLVSDSGKEKCGLSDHDEGSSPPHLADKQLRKQIDEFPNVTTGHKLPLKKSVLSVCESGLQQCILPIGPLTFKVVVMSVPDQSSGYSSLRIHFRYTQRNFPLEELSCVSEHPSFCRVPQSGEEIPTKSFSVGRL